MSSIRRSLVSSLLSSLVGFAVIGCGHKDVSPGTSPIPSHPGTAFRFVDVAQHAGLKYRWTIAGTRPINILQGIGNGCAFLDYDNDGNLDILLVGSSLALYKGDGHGHFTDVTHQTGLDHIHGHFLGCAVGDYDNDGYEDIYLTAYRGGALLHNEGGRDFKDVTRQAGIQPQPWGAAASWIDADNDGKLDLYIGNYVAFGPQSKQLCRDNKVMGACGPLVYKALAPHFYRNLGRGRFADETKKWHLDTLVGAALGVAPGDFDGCGHQGLYIGNDERYANLLKGNGQTFSDIGRSSGTAAGGNGYPQGDMGVDWGDYDNDGRLDLAVATFMYLPNAIYHNDGGDLFTEHSGSLGIGDETLRYLKFGEKWIDVDNSGWLDLIISNGHIADNAADIDAGAAYRQPTLLFQNIQGAVFVDASQGLIGEAARPIVGRGLAIGDFDNDGRMDALVVDSEGLPLLLHNVTPNVGRWIEFNLVGVKSNRDGQGALVTVQSGEQKLIRLCTTSGSYMSASDKRVHVGLGSAGIAGSITIKWPSGHSDTFRNLQSDRIYTVREGSSAPVSTTVRK